MVGSADAGDGEVMWPTSVVPSSREITTSVERVGAPAGPWRRTKAEDANESNFDVAWVNKRGG